MLADKSEIRKARYEFFERENETQTKSMRSAGADIRIMEKV